MSEINVDENFDFRAWLKNFAPGNFDAIVKALSDWTKRTRKIKMVTPNLKLTAKLEVKLLDWIRSELQNRLTLRFDQIRSRPRTCFRRI